MRLTSGSDPEAEIGLTVGGEGHADITGAAAVIVSAVHTSARQLFVHKLIPTLLRFPILARILLTRVAVARPAESEGGRQYPASGEVITDHAAFGRFGTIRIASPSSTTLPSTEQVQSKRARRLAGISSTRLTVATTRSPIFTGPRKLSVCET